MLLNHEGKYIFHLGIATLWQYLEHMLRSVLETYLTGKYINFEEKFSDQKSNVLMVFKYQVAVYDIIN